MASKNYKQKKIQDTEGGKFGTYTEDTGGGHPFNTSNTRTTKENGKYRKANNKTMQPRTDDGKFTYKSANGQSIDPKYGPSRGKTVNPVLTGGKNGIKIEDVEKQFAEGKGNVWDEFKDKWYRKGGEAVVNGLKVKVAGIAIWDVAKEYNEELGEYKGIASASDYNKGKYTGESEIFEKSKLGRTSNAAKAAKQKAKSTKESQFVIDQKTGGIKGGQEELQKKVNEKPYKKKETPVAPKAPTTETPTTKAPVAETPVSEKAPVAETKSGVKYGSEQLAKIKDYFMNDYFKDNPEKGTALVNKLFSLTPEQIDAQIDKWKSKGLLQDI